LKLADEALITIRRDLTPIYRELAEEFCEMAEKYSLESTEDFKYSLISILMSAFYMEAFINKFGADMITPKSDLWEALEKCSPQGKWLLVPLVATGKTFENTNEDPYNSYNQLREVRNDLAHYKPEFVDVNKDLRKYVKHKRARHYLDITKEMVDKLEEWNKERSKEAGPKI